jgi:hypothetical protein
MDQAVKKFEVDTGTKASLIIGFKSIIAGTVNLFQNFNFEFDRKLKGAGIQQGSFWNIHLTHSKFDCRLLLSSILGHSIV